MHTLVEIVLYLIGVIQFLVIAHIIISLLVAFEVLNPRQPLVMAIWQGLERLFKPIYDPIRRILPDTRPLDLSPIVLMVGLHILTIIIT